MKTDSVTMLIEENNQLREKLNAANNIIRFEKNS